MATTSFTVLRRIAGFAFALMLVSLCLTGAAAGQGSPLVTASAAAGLSHPTGWGTIQETALDQAGDWWVVDYANGGLYEFPVGGGAAISIAPSSPSASLGGGYQNPVVVIDPGNNLYLGANWNNCLVKFSWNAATGTWTGLNDGGANDLSPSNPTTTICTNSGNGNEPQAWAQYSIPDLTGSGIIGNYGYFQPWAVAAGNNNSLIVGLQGGNNGIDVQGLSVTGAWSNPTVAGWNWVPLTGMTARAISIAQDPEGNVYLVEDSGGLPGVLEIPGTATNGQYQQVGKVSGDATLARVDPNLPAVKGVATDAAGNLYISDSQVGVVMVPNPSGTPQTASAVLISGVPSGGQVAYDSTRDVMYVPTSQTQTNSQADVAKVGFGYAEYGSSAVGTTVATGSNVVFGFNGPATPASFVIAENGVSTPDFAITGGTCTSGVAYAANKSCLENVSFTPQSVGNISAKLLMLDANNNILASMVLHGTGMGANIQVSPAVQSSIGSNLMTPSQVTTDAKGNIYIADPGQAKVLMYAVGSSTVVSLGTGLTTPTGVAVDGSGDVFIADSGAGSVYEVPFGPSGLNTTGQVTLVSGLGTTGLQLAADGLGNLYVADPSNGRVIKLSNVGASTASNLGQTEAILTAGFTSPSAVAVDESNNLYVIDGTNLFEVQGGRGAPTTLLNNLAGATGLAIDPSGAVYISSASETTRTPSISGILVPADATQVTPGSLANASSVALDRANNVYLVQSSGGAVTVVSTNSALPLATPASLTSTTSAIATITNTGNSALTVTNYTVTNPLNAQQPSYLQLPVDFTAADTATGGCEAGSPVAAGATCTVNVTFAPGAGEQGTETGTIGVVSSAINAPTTITATGTASALTSSATTVAGGATAAQVINTPLSITVAPKSGAGTPTGTVTVTYKPGTVATPNSGANAAGRSDHHAGIGEWQRRNLTNGAASFTLAPVLAGTQTMTVYYSGDRVYGRSTGTMSVSVAKSAITGIALPVLPRSDGCQPAVRAGGHRQRHRSVRRVGTALSIQLHHDGRHCRGRSHRNAYDHGQRDVVPAGNVRSGNWHGNLHFGRIRNSGRILGRGMSELISARSD